jgi:hypothetical protein
VPDWDDEPEESRIEFFETALDRHSKVAGYEREAPQVYRITRRGMDDVRLYLEDVYVLGIVDYDAIRAAHPDIRCIVTAGNWNYFAAETHEAAGEDDVALFDISGLLGALNKDGEGFYRHIPRK